MMKATTVSNQIKITIVKRRFQGAAFMPINNHAAIVSTLFGEQERLCRKVEAVSLIVLLGEEYRIGSRSASQVKHPRARREPGSKYVCNHFSRWRGVVP